MPHVDYVTSDLEMFLRDISAQAEVAAGEGKTTDPRRFIRAADAPGQRKMIRLASLSLAKFEASAGRKNAPPFRRSEIVP